MRLILVCCQEFGSDAASALSANHKSSVSDFVALSAMSRLQVVVIFGHRRRVEGSHGEPLSSLRGLGVQFESVRVRDHAIASVRLAGVYTRFHVSGKVERVELAEQAE